MDHARGRTSRGHHDKRQSLHQRDQDTSEDENRGKKKAKVDDQAGPSGQALGQDRGKKKAKVDDQAGPSGQALEQEATGRRSRQGRRRGSDNMPNPRSKFRDTGDGMKAHVLEVAEGEDVCESLRTYLAEFTTTRKRGVFVIGGSGTVANVSLLQPPARGDHRPRETAFDGSFSIISLSGEFLPSPYPPMNRGLTVAVAGTSGLVIGGTVRERGLPAAGPVLVHAVSFRLVSYKRLPGNARPVQSESSHGQRQNAQPDHGGSTNSASPQMGQLPSNSDVTAMSKATASRPPKHPRPPKPPRPPRPPPSPRPPQP